MKTKTEQSTNSLWKAHVQARNLTLEVEALGHALVRQAAPPELVDEIREVFLGMRAASERLTAAYNAHGGSV